MALAPKNKKWAGYGLYIILVTLFLFYYLFPEQAVEEFVDSNINSINPQLGFKAENIGLWVPAGLRITSGSVFYRDSAGSPVFTADSLYIGPKIFRMFTKEYSFDLQGRAYTGEIDGTVLAGKDGDSTIESDLSFSELDLAGYELLAEKFTHRIIGKLSGTIKYAKGAAEAVGNGEIDLRLKDGQLLFEKPLLGIDSVDLQNIDIELEMRNREITVVRAELAGTEANGSLTGTIQLQPDINMSQLNLKGTLEPLAEFYKNHPEIRELLKNMRKRVTRGQYSFTISGTLGDPRFRLL
jgi:type II secretion system protein N